MANRSRLFDNAIFSRNHVGLLAQRMQTQADQMGDRYQADIRMNSCVEIVTMLLAAKFALWSGPVFLRVLVFRATVWCRG